MALSLPSGASGTQALGGLLPLSSRRVGGAPPKFGMTMWFNVLVPELDEAGPSSLGSWSGCSGLSVKFAPEGPIDEGGKFGVQRYLPGKITYTEVTLERAMTWEGAKRVREWLQQQTQRWGQGEPTPAQSQPVVIELRSGLGAGAMVHSWELHDAVPTSWSMPSFSATGTGAIALEKLTFAHAGFLKPLESASGMQLKLVEKLQKFKELSFLCNPAKITITKSREADSKHKKSVSTSVVVVDPNAMSVTLGDLRLEGCKAIAEAGPLLKRWVMLDGAPARRAQAPEPAEGTKTKDCETCHQKLPDAAVAEASGKHRVLQPVWGTDRGGMPFEVVLKSYTLNFTRFTVDGRPSRATVSLTLQEVDGTTTIGGHRSKPAAESSGTGWKAAQPGGTVR